MAHVKYLFETASCVFPDRSALSYALEFLEEKLILPKRHTGADIIMFEDLDIVVAVFDRRDDGQSRA